MFQSFRRLSFFFMVLLSFQAFSFIGGALGGGYRGALHGAIGSGPEIKAHFHLDPLVFVPVSFGASFSYVALAGLPEEKKVDLGEVSLEVAAWLPFKVFYLTPYVRAAVPVYNFFIGPDSKGIPGRAFAGFHGTAGIRWDFVPMLSIFAEGGAGLSRYEVYDKEAAGSFRVLGGLQVTL